MHANLLKNDANLNLDPGLQPALHSLNHSQKNKGIEGYRKDHSADNTSVELANIVQYAKADNDIEGFDLSILARDDLQEESIHNNEKEPDKDITH